MAVKKFVLVLTDEAQANPERFVPQLEQAVGDRGCRNFQYLAQSGVAFVDFDGVEANLGQLPGVLAVEPEQTAHTCTDNGLVENPNRQTPEEVAAYWTPERIAAAQPVPMPQVAPDTPGLAEHPVAVLDENGKPVGTFGKW